MTVTRTPGGTVSRTRNGAVAVALLLATPTLLAAQMVWGGTAGLNMSQFGGSDATNTSYTYGVLVGVTATKQAAGSKMFWESGAQFAMRGSGFDFAGSSATTTINYLEIPVMVGWTFPTATGRMTPYITGGIILGLKLSCNSDSGGSSTDCGDNVTGIDFPLALGGGLKDFGPGEQWGAAILYNLGLATIDKPASGSAADIKNGGLTFKVTYRMKKK